MQAQDAQGQPALGLEGQGAVQLEAARFGPGLVGRSLAQAGAVGPAGEVQISGVLHEEHERRFFYPPQGLGAVGLQQARHVQFRVLVIEKTITGFELMGVAAGRLGVRGPGLGGAHLSF